MLICRLAFNLNMNFRYIFGDYISMLVNASSFETVYKGLILASTKHLHNLQGGILFVKCGLERLNVCTPVQHVAKLHLGLSSKVV